MNLDELEKTWSLQAVAGDNRIVAPEIQNLLTREVRHRADAVRRVIGVAGFAVVIGWSVALAAHFTGIRPFNVVTTIVFIIGTCFDLLFLALGFQSLRRMEHEAAAMGETLLACVRGTLRVVDWQLRDCARLMRGALALFAGSGCLYGLEYLTHNLPGRGVIVGLIVAGVLSAGIAATIERYRRVELRPRQAKLQEQLDALES